MRLIFPVALLLCTALSLQAQSNRYVAPDGDNSAAGSESAPWQTVAFAARRAEPGDSILVRAGRYREAVIITRSGRESAPIVLIGYPGEEAILDGAGLDLPDGQGVLSVLSAAHIVVEGIRIENSGSELNNGGILVQESNNVRISRCHTFNTRSSGIGVWASESIIVSNNVVEKACNGGEQECLTIAQTTNFVVHRNVVHGGGPDSNGAEGIDVKEGSSNGVVTENHVYDTPAVGIYVDAFDADSRNIRVARNRVHDIDEGLGGTQGIGIMIASEAGGHLSNVRVENNLVYDCDLFGIVLSDCCMPQHLVENITLMNNTVVGNGVGRDGGGIFLSNPQAVNVVVRNNIIAANGIFQIGVSDAPILASSVIDHNLINGPTSLAGNVFGNDAVRAVPGFRDAANEDFRLLGTSEAVDAGSSFGAPGEDFDGTLRPVGAAVDIGAFEHPGGQTGAVDNRVRNEPSLGLFPNPVDDQLTLHGDLSTTDGIDVVDVTGRIVLRRSSRSFSVAELVPGSYGIRCVGPDGVRRIRATFLKR